jgi:hypothetical protein
MSDIVKRNRDRRRARTATRLMRHAEAQWRAEIERLRGILRRIAGGEDR